MTSLMWTTLHLLVLAGAVFSHYISTNDNESYSDVRPIDENKISCAVGNDKTFIFSIKVHPQKAVVDTIMSESNLTMATEHEKSVFVENYFSQIADHINDALLKFNVQVRFEFPNSENLYSMPPATKAISCRHADAIERKTAVSLDYLKAITNNHIGLHLYIWGCIDLKENILFSKVAGNSICGRVGGVLWTDVDLMPKLLADTVFGMLASEQSVGELGLPVSGLFRKLLCDYAYSCLAINKTEYGITTPEQVSLRSSGEGDVSVVRDSS